MWAIIQTLQEDILPSNVPHATITLQESSLAVHVHDLPYIPMLLIMCCHYPSVSLECV